VGKGRAMDERQKRVSGDDVTPERAGGKRKRLEVEEQTKQPAASDSETLKKGGMHKRKRRRKCAATAVPVS